MRDTTDKKPDDGKTRRQWLWFVVLYLAGLLATGILVYGLRAFIKFI